MTDAKRILLVRARTPQEMDQKPSVLGTIYRGRDGWRFNPLVAGRKVSRKAWPTWEAAIPRWTGGLDRTESRRMEDGEDLVDVLDKFPVETPEPDFAIVDGPKPKTEAVVTGVTELPAPKKGITMKHVADHYRREQQRERENKLYDIGRATYENIVELLNAQVQAETEEEREEAEEALNNDPLSIQVRSGWVNVAVACDDTQATTWDEYEILLTTGGPAVRIRGSLDEYGEPRSAFLQAQDWFTDWMTMNLTEAEQQDVLTYARWFYYGG